MALGIPIIGDIIDAVGDIVSEVVVDKDKRIAVQAELEKLRDRANERLHEEAMAQSATNTEEAKHRSVFIAGWRPFIGWVSGIGIGWTFVISPFVEFFARLMGWKGAMPVVDTATLMTLVLAMLGVVGARSFDKLKGTSDDAPLGKPLVYKPEKRGFPKNIIPENVPWMK